MCPKQEEELVIKSVVELNVKRLPSTFAVSTSHINIELHLFFYCVLLQILTMHYYASSE